MNDNPYQSPGVVSDESPPSDLIRQLEVRTMEWFLRANDGVVFMLFSLSFAMAAWTIVFALKEHDGSEHWLLMGCAFTGILSGALAWFQWRYHLAAIAISGTLSLAMLLAVMGAVLSLIAHHAVGRPPLSSRMEIANDAIALFAGVAFVAGWTYVVSLPLRVAMQAWAWHRQGIDVGRIREEIRRRG